MTIKSFRYVLGLVVFTLALFPSHAQAVQPEIRPDCAGDYLFDANFRLEQSRAFAEGEKIIVAFSSVPKGKLISPYKTTLSPSTFLGSSWMTSAFGGHWPLPLHFVMIDKLGNELDEYEFDPMPYLNPGDIVVAWYQASICEGDETAVFQPVGLRAVHYNPATGLAIGIYRYHHYWLT